MLLHRVSTMQESIRGVGQQYAAERKQHSEQDAGVQQTCQLTVQSQEVCYRHSPSGARILSQMSTEFTHKTTGKAELADSAGFWPPI